MRLRRGNGTVAVGSLEGTVMERKEGLNPRDGTAHQNARLVESSTLACTEWDVVRNVEGWAIRLVTMASQELAMSVVRKDT
jgi:hypothetical protein